MTQYKVLENIYLAKDDKTLLVDEVVELDPKRVKAINASLGREVLVKLDLSPKKAGKKDLVAED